MLTFLFIFDTLLFPQILANYSYTTKYIEVPVDHFTFTTNATFNLRYLYNCASWQKGGPIFFYPGNEGNIELFVQSTGFVWETAERFGALVVFAEHRYYGESLPFEELSLVSLEYLGYLTSAQVIADYVALLDHLQNESRSPCPVIAFGGSYGGMLAAWMRYKYPAMVYGVIASSAPIWQFKDLVPCNAFNKIVTRVYCDCSDLIKKSWKILRIVQSESGKYWLTRTFKLCRLVEIEIFIDWLAGIYGDIAMVNYPYETDFIKPLPANPVDVVCGILINGNSTNEEAFIVALAKAISVYTNFTETTVCNDLTANDSKLGEQEWDFQVCTEMVMPMCSTSAEMFEEKPWDFYKFSEACLKKWGARPNPQLPLLQYGGKNLDGYSNIVFSNGLQDPWSSGGVLKDYSDTVLAIVIPDAAHHLDFRASHPKDPLSVKNARSFHQKMIWKWLKEYYGEQRYC